MVQTFIEHPDKGGIFWHIKYPSIYAWHSKVQQIISLIICYSDLLRLTLSTNITEKYELAQF